MQQKPQTTCATDGSNNVKARYIKGVNYIAKADSKGTLSYFLYNGHGDVVKTTDEAGTVQNQYNYDIWGNPTLTVETAENAIRYSGEIMDSETGLYYLRARFYDPFTGRFITEDSYWGEDRNPLSLNLYTYCTNDPIRYTDPTGHWQKGDEDLNDEAKAKIIAIGNAWNAAKTKEQKDAIHQQADDIRKNKDSWEDFHKTGIKTDTLVKIENVSKFDQAMTAAMADGKITKEEDRNAQKLIGVKISSSTKDTTTAENRMNGFKSSTYSSTTTIGKADIKVSATTVTSTKNINAVSTGSNIQVTTHYSAYVFYMPDRKSYAEDDVKRIAAYYDIDKKDIGTAMVLIYK